MANLSPSPTRDSGRADLLTVASVTVLVGTEIVGAALAAGWALSGLMQLPQELGYALMALLTGLGLYLTVLFARRARQVEARRVGAARAPGGKRAVR